ncbi:MAG: WxL protein peptidoglycan domain-containing protein [Culicoidibacterales bacterium]
MTSIKKMGKICLVLAFFIVSLGVNMLAVEAQLSVEIIKPPNQITGNTTYFDLAVEPNKQQDLELNLVNGSDETVSLQVQITNAYTTINGNVDYSPTEVPESETLKYPLKTLLTLEDEQITLAPGESHRVKMTLATPIDLPQGVILGGIHIKKLIPENKDGATTIDQAYAIVKGVKLSYGELPPSNITVGDVTADKLQRKSAVSIKMSNRAPVIEKEVIVTAKIFKGKNLFKADEQKIVMAPNSDVKLPIRLNQEKLEPGDYSVDIDIRNGEDVSNHKRKFSVTREEAKAVETEKFLLEEQVPIWIFWLLGLLGVIIIGMGIFLFRQRKHRKADRA